MRVTGRKCDLKELPEFASQAFRHVAIGGVLFCHVADCKLSLWEKWDGFQTYGKTSDWVEVCLITPTIVASAQLAGNRAGPELRQMDLLDYTGTGNLGEKSDGYQVEVRGREVSQWVIVHLGTKLLQAEFIGVLQEAAAKAKDTRGQVPQKTATAEDRLRSLDRLYKDGVIGKAEYDQKRAEILRAL